VSDVGDSGAPSVLFSNASGLEGVGRRGSWTPPASEGERAPAHDGFSFGSLRAALDEELPIADGALVQ